MTKMTPDDIDLEIVNKHIRINFIMITSKDSQTRSIAHR
jgi:hypothetical protein